MLTLLSNVEFTIICVIKKFISLYDMIRFFISRNLGLNITFACHSDAVAKERQRISNGEAYQAMNQRGITRLVLPPPKSIHHSGRAHYTFRQSTSFSDEISVESKISRTYSTAGSLHFCKRLFQLFEFQETAEVLV
jgi:hypothetical protein